MSVPFWLAVRGLGRCWVGDLVCSGAYPQPCGRTGISTKSNGAMSISTTIRPGAVLYASPAERLYQTPNTMSNGWVVFVDNFCEFLSRAFNSLGQIVTL